MKLLRNDSSWFVHGGKDSLHLEMYHRFPINSYYPEDEFQKLRNIAEGVSRPMNIGLAGVDD